MRRFSSMVYGLALSLVVALAADATAGCKRGRSSSPAGSCGVATQACSYAYPGTYATGTYQIPLALPVPESARSAPTDGGFVAWLNATRAAYHLAPVVLDAGLCGEARVNSSRGFGHSFMGSARRQNVGMGPASAVWRMWLASPTHAVALLDPTITVVGIAAAGDVWTFDAR